MRRANRIGSALSGQASAKRERGPPNKFRPPCRSRQKTKFSIAALVEHGPTCDQKALEVGLYGSDECRIASAACDERAELIAEHSLALRRKLLDLNLDLLDVQVGRDRCRKSPDFIAQL